MSDRQRLACVWLSWMALAALIYYPVVGLHTYSDDSVQIEIALGLQPFNESTYFFRPLQSGLIAWDWQWSGSDFVASKALAFLLLLVRTALVYGLARRAMPRASAVGPMLVSWLYLAHPLLVAATGKIDNNTEGLCAAIALGLVYVALSTSMSDARKLALSAVLLIVGFATKESIVGIAAAVPVFMWVSGSPHRVRLARSAAVITGVLLAGYFLARWMAGRTALNVVPQSRYELHIGLNVIRNAVASTAAMLFPGSLLDVFVRLRPIYLAWSAVLVFVVLIARARRGFALSTPAQRLFLVAMIAGLFPVVLLNGWPSEHHLTTSAAFALLLVACPLLDAPNLSPRIAGIAAILIAWMGFNSWTKTVAERRMSDRAQQIGVAMMSAYERAPTPHVQLCAVFDPSKKYGQFKLPDHYMALHQLYRFRVSYPAVTIGRMTEIKSAADAGESCTLVADGLSVVSR